MDPCTGRQWLWSIWQQLRTGYGWISSIMLNELDGGGWRQLWSNVQLIFEMQGTKAVGATRDKRWIWESAWAKLQVVSSPSCELPNSWMEFAGSWMATISFDPPTNTKFCIPLWDTGRSHLSSSTKTDAWMSHTYSYRYSSTPWGSKYLTKCIWDYLHAGKWSSSPYMARLVWLLLFECFPGESLTQSGNILDRNEANYREGDCRACNLTSKDNPCLLC